MYFESANKKIDELEKELNNANNVSDVIKKAEYFRDNVLTKIINVRKDVDMLETLVPSDIWPTPTYSDMLYKL
jgi:glutamine synthetase